MINTSSSPGHESITEDQSVHVQIKDYIETKSFTKMKRKRKSETIGRNYICEKCNVAYLSYPALYTHNRNKHSMIPITSKNKFFKSSLTIRTKFRYSREESIKNVKPLISKLLTAYVEVFRSYTMNPESIFYNKGAEMSDDIIWKRLNDPSAYRTKTETNSANQTIVEAIVSYIVMMIKITKDKAMVHLIALFAFLMKEYLELFGWDYHEEMLHFGLENNAKEKTGLYYEVFDCEGLPNVIDDFSTRFLLVDEGIFKKQKEIMDVCHNFCLWLYKRNLTSYQLIRVN